MANKHMKGCSTSLVIKEMQIKATWDATPHTHEDGYGKQISKITRGGEYGEAGTSRHRS